MAYDEHGYMPRRRRPLGITLLAVLQLLASLMIILSGALLLLGSIITEFDFGPIVGAIILLFGLIGLFVAISLLSGKAWAWYLMLVFTLLSLVTDLVGIFVTGGASILALVIHVVILYYLFRPNVKGFFGI